SASPPWSPRALCSRLSRLSRRRWGDWAIGNPQPTPACAGPQAWGRLAPTRPLRLAAGRGGGYEPGAAVAHGTGGPVVSKKRKSRPPAPAPPGAGAPPAEAAAAAEGAPEPEKGSDEGRISVFWRVFGGTLLSITAQAGAGL